LKLWQDPTVSDTRRYTFTREELQEIAYGQSIDPSFDAAEACERALAVIDATGRFARGPMGGGMGPFEACVVEERAKLVHREGQTFLPIKPLAFYLSECVPVAVVGRTTASLGTGFCVVQDLRPDQLLDPVAPSDDVERFVIDVIAQTGFALLTPADVNQPMPAGLKEPDYLISGYWEAIFDVLFRDTD
jgi:hypothetical protein